MLKVNHSRTKWDHDALTILILLISHAKIELKKLKEDDASCLTVSRNLLKQKSNKFCWMNISGRNWIKQNMET